MGKIEQMFYIMENEMARDSVDMFIALLTSSELPVLHKQLKASPRTDSWMIEEVERQMLLELLDSECR